MIERDFDSALLTDFYEYIRDVEVRTAFAYLIGVFTCLRTVTLIVKRQGEVRSVRMYQDGKYFFSMMPSQCNINFHFRPPVLREHIYQKEEIATLFESFDDSSHKNDEHWAVDIRNVDEARRLVQVLGFR